MLFAFVVLLVGLLFQAIPSPVSRTYKQYPPDNNQNAANTSALPSALQEQGRADQNRGGANDHTKENMPWWEDAALATWWLVGVGILGTFAALGTLLYVRRSADAAFLNAQALINSERAWVDIEIIPQVHTPTIYDLKITNHGRTPALVFTFDVGAESSPLGTFLWSAAKTFDATKASYKKLGESVRIFLRQATDQTTPAAVDLSHAFIKWDAVRNGQESGLVYFKVAYLDVINGKDRTREPCETSCILAFEQKTRLLQRMARFDTYK